MKRVILYQARLPGRLAPADAAALAERIPYAKRVALAARREDRDASLTGIALALAAAGAIRGRAIAPEALRFPPDQRPRFASPGAPAFSISHSLPFVVAAAAAEGVVGVDIERGEASRLSAQLRREWTAREAVVKALGLGLRAAPEVQLRGTRATLRGHVLWLTPLTLEGGADGWLATDTGPVDLHASWLDPLAALRRHAA